MYAQYEALHLTYIISKQWQQVSEELDFIIHNHDLLCKLQTCYVCNSLCTEV